jgi:hypothetical protein
MEAIMKWSEILMVGDEVILTGDLSAGYLSYETRVFLSSCQLNVLINNIQLMNPEAEVLELWETFQAMNGGKCYLLKSENIPNCFLDMGIFSDEEKIYQVRA